MVLLSDLKAKLSCASALCLDEMRQLPPVLRRYKQLLQITQEQRETHFWPIMRKFLSDEEISNAKSHIDSVSAFILIESHMNELQIRVSVKSGISSRRTALGSTVQDKSAAVLMAVGMLICLLQLYEISDFPQYDIFTTDKDLLLFFDRLFASGSTDTMEYLKFDLFPSIADFLWDVLKKGKQIVVNDYVPRDEFELLRGIKLNMKPAMVENRSKIQVLKGMIADQELLNRSVAGLYEQLETGTARLLDGECTCILESLLSQNYPSELDALLYAKHTTMLEYRLQEGKAVCHKCGSVYDIKMAEFHCPNCGFTIKYIDEPWAKRVLAMCPYCL